MKIKIYFVFVLLLFLFITPFSFAFFSKFIVNNTPVSFTIDVLQSTTTPLNVSIDPSYSSLLDAGEGGALYKISRLHFCTDYDIDGNCIDQVSDLCPYISLEPNTQIGTVESTENGFSQNMDNVFLQANGEISDTQDIVDNWNIKIHSPCFQGECPNGYDQNVRGVPLDSSLKGKTFHCQVVVESVDPPVLVQRILGTNKVFAFNQKNAIDVTVTFTGSGYVDQTSKISNVLFIPGLEASRLYEKKTILGLQIEDQLWEPNANSDAKDLFMDTNGKSIKQGIYTKDIIEETNTPVPVGFAGQNIYKSFSKMMNDMVRDNVIVAWQSFPYDWRKGVQDIVDNGIEMDGSNFKLDQAVDYLSSASRTGKVTIISHSNGGLITKAFLKKLIDDKTAGRNNLIDKIDKVILVASPQLGTPSAVPAILHGYDQDINPFYIYSLINTETARELARNMPSAYGLVPSSEYFNHITNPVISFTQNILDPYISNQIINFGQTILNYHNERNYMIGTEGRISPATSDILKPIKANSSLLTQAEKLHSDIDNLVLPSSIKVIQIAGWGIDTISGFEYETSKPCPLPTTMGCTGKYILDERPIFTSDGDKTVVSPSALAMSGEKWYIDVNRYNIGFTLDRDHHDLLEVNPIINLISSIIKNEDYSKIKYTSTTTPIDNSNRLRLSVHSPVDIDSYDNFGNHTGKVCQNNFSSCYIEEGIPNSSYYEFGEGKYINIPETNLKNITLEGNGIGTFTFEADIVHPDNSKSSFRFVDIPVTTLSKGEVNINQNSIPLLKLDVSGDGIADFAIEPSNDFDPIMYLQIMKSTINTLDISRNKKLEFNKKIDNIIKSLQKNKSKKALETINKFKYEISKNMYKKDREHDRKKNISKSDAQMLLDMLNKLLDNLI
jgi:hypothetical protein